MFSARRIVTSLAAFGLVLGIAGGAYAFTAANVVPASMAGDGTGAITGYTVSAIHYTLDTTTPTNVKTLTFTVNTAPVAGSTLKSKLGGTWYACTNVSTAVTCDTTVGTQLTVVNATSLEALIAD